MVPGTLLVAMLAQELAPASVSTALAVTTIKAASLVATGQLSAAGLISASAVTLAKEVGRAMFFTKVQIAAMVLAVAVAASGTGMLAYQALGVKESDREQLEGPTRLARRVDKPEQGQPQPRGTDSYGDPLPSGAVARLGTKRFRHEGEANSVVFSRNGKVLAARCEDGMILLWDASTGKGLQRLRGMARGLPIDRLIDFSPDGAFLAGPADDTRIGFWDTATGHLQRTVALPEVTQRPGNDGGDIATVRFSPNGKLLAIGGCNDSYVLDVATGQVLHHFKEHIDGVTFSPDGRSLIAQVTDLKQQTNELQLRDARTGRLLRAQSIPPGADHTPGRGEELTCAIAFSPDGKTMASSGTDRILLWDAATGKLRSRFEAKMGQVKNLAFALDGTVLVSGSESDGKVHVWDVATGKQRAILNARMGVLRSMTLSPDGKTVAAGTVHSTIRLLDLTTGNELFPEYVGHDARVKSVAFSPDGRLLASGGDNGQVWLWDAGTGKPLRALRGPSARCVAFSPDGRSLAILAPGSFYPGKYIDIYETRTGKELLRLQAGDANDVDVKAMAFSPDGKMLLSVDWKNPVKIPGAGGAVIGRLNIWDLQTGKRLREFPMEGLRPECLAISPNGREVVVAGCSDSQSVRVWDLLRGEETLAFRAGQLVESIALSPDGRTMISGGGVDKPEESLCLWEMSTGKEIYALNAQDQEVTAVAFSPDGRIVASSGIRQKNAVIAQESPGIRLWDVATGQEIRHLEQCASTVTSLAFSPDGSRLASGLQNSTVLLWEVLPAPPKPWQAGTKRGLNELEALWSDLAAEDVRKAYQAIHLLAALPAQAVLTLAGRLRPVAEPDPMHIDRRIADLDSNQFAVRAAAAKELAMLGEMAEPALRQALKGKPSVELRKRVESLLASMRAARPQETLRTLRAIAVLERIGTPDAKRVLEKFATGAAGARETRDARDALDRLARQPVRVP
jgi:WD40 repeat protein